MTVPGPETANQLATTFFDRRHLPSAIAFYEDLPELRQAMYQGWCKICDICPDGHVGPADEARGINKRATQKSVWLRIPVPDFEEWFRHAGDEEPGNLSVLFVNDEIKIQSVTWHTA